MIKESDIKAGNVLRYLGGSIAYAKHFTVGKAYNIEEFGDDSLYILNDEEDAIDGTIFRRLRLWDLIHCHEEPSKSSNEISLTLTQDEAQVLADVLSLVGGSNVNSRRKYALQVLGDLHSRGFEYSSLEDYTGLIHFTEFNRETVEYNGSTYDKVEFDMMLEKLEKL